MLYNMLNVIKLYTYMNVVVIDPFDCVIASNTCLYCSQLVTPVNLGTLVDVNTTRLDRTGEFGPPNAE